MKTKNANRFNEDFFTTTKEEAGKAFVGIPQGHQTRQTRNEDNGHYHRVAMNALRYFKDKNMVEIGCGMGWITKHIRFGGGACVGFDISQWAIDNAVPGAIVWCQDLLDDDIRWVHTSGGGTHYNVNQWEVAIMSNVIEYLEKEEVPHAIANIAKMFTDYAFCTVQTKENILRNWGALNEKNNPRKTFESWDWWKEQFEKAGLVLGSKHYEIANDVSNQDFLVPIGEDGRPTLFVLEHKK